MEKEQETLEEVAEKYCLINNIPIDQMIVKNDRSCEFETPITMFVKGAKWQQERMYSEGDVDKLINIIQWYDNESDVRIDPKTFIWFEQFKKK